MANDLEDSAWKGHGHGREETSRVSKPIAVLPAAGLAQRLRIRQESSGASAFPSHTSIHHSLPTRRLTASLWHSLITTGRASAPLVKRCTAARKISETTHVGALAGRQQWVVFRRDSGEWDVPDRLRTAAPPQGLLFRSFHILLLLPDLRLPRSVFLGGTAVSYSPWTRGSHCRTGSGHLNCSILTRLALESKQER